MAVIALGLAAGFAASRFLKASSRERYESRAYATPANGPATRVPATPAPATPAPATPTGQPPIREYGP
jgi:hypothetical protein